MPVRSDSQVVDHAVDVDDGLANSEDISGGVSTSLPDAEKHTLFIDVDGAVDVTVELSPDGGTNWFEPGGDSPLSYSGATTDVVLIEYVADSIRLTGDNTTAVSATVRSLY